jgi:hypothetical protein
MIVTLDIYSGRPNPSWRLSAKDASRVLERVAGKVMSADAESLEHATLGPRGFLIEASGDDDMPTGIASTFRAGSLQPAAFQGGPAEVAFSASDSQEFSRFLLRTGRHVVDDDLMEYLDQSVSRLSPVPAQPADALWPQPAEPAPEEPENETEDLRQAVAAAACVLANTAYNPGFWNTPAIQPKNNCYNYAMNYRSDTFAQPGRFSGHMYTAINCANVGAAANWDGCKATCSGSNKLVALVIAPGPAFVDFHWYRRHSNGFWGHKPGGTAARNTDNRGRVINGTTLTPANCERGPYTIFCGYRYSPTGMRVS